jgi:CO/xanthine dehydrogenase Mo-binding subunit
MRSQSSHDRTLNGIPLRAPASGTHHQAIFTRPFILHASIGLACGLARFEEGRLTVWTHSQGVFVLREWLGRTLDLDVGKITVIHCPGAGCYGHNGADDAAFDAAFLASCIPGKTIRVQWSRQDELSAAPLGAAMSVGITAALNSDGYPASWRMDIWSPVHGRRPGMNGNANLLGAEALAAPLPTSTDLADVPDAMGGGATRNAVALYDLPDQEIVHHLLTDIPVRTSTIRGLGSHLNTIAIECFLDELAEQTGVDPIEYRLALTSDPRVRRVIETAANLAGWRAGESGGEGTGRGFGFGRYKNRAAYMAVVAEVEVDEEVRLKRIWASVDAGLVINPDGAENQIEGGIIQAASWTLKERVRFEAGRIVSDTWNTYPIMRFSDVPPVEVRFVGTRDDPPLGIGEAPIGPAAAAIVNAASHALGARLRELPRSRERIMEVLLAN